MIREATVDDIPSIVDMGERMAARAALAVGYDPVSVAATLSQLIESPEGILLVSKSGMIGGLCYPHPFNHAVKVGQEFFWYSEEGVGLDLLDVCEAQAKDLGAKFWTMFCMATMRPRAVGRLLEWRGYVANEHSYIKEL
jgi:N-acetylglutamate synthase-like GNAT family acetyltransferase